MMRSQPTATAAGSGLTGRIANGVGAVETVAVVTAATGASGGIVARGPNAQKGKLLCRLPARHHRPLSFQM